MDVGHGGTWESTNGGVLYGQRVSVRSFSQSHLDLRPIARNATPWSRGSLEDTPVVVLVYRVRRLCQLEHASREAHSVHTVHTPHG